MAREFKRDVMIGSLCDAEVPAVAEFRIGSGDDVGLTAMTVGGLRINLPAAIDLCGLAEVKRLMADAQEWWCEDGCRIWGVTSDD